ncbi:hypothetical protein QTP88_022377 [Uroleucon formosanum]
MIETLLHLKKWTSAPIQAIWEETMEFTDISAPSLCRVELMEYRGACLSWITLLRDTPQPIGILSPPITTTSMSATFVVTETIPVDVHGSIDRYFGPERDEEDLVEFLE